MKPIGRKFLGAVSLMAMIGASGTTLFGSGTAGGTLLGSEPNGMAIDFTAATPHMLVRDAGVTLNYSGRPFYQGPLGDAGKLSYTGASLRMKYNSSGTLEFAGHNISVRSQEFDNASWANSNGTVTANATAAPDGTTTADNYKTTNANTFFRLLGPSPTVSAGALVRASIYAKYDTHPYISFGINDGVAKAYNVLVNLQTGTLIGNHTAALNQVAPVSSSIESIGSGWYRITVTAQLDAARTAADVVIYIAEDGNVASDIFWSAAGTEAFQLWGAQLNVLPCSDTTYFPTVASAYFGPRIDFNPATLAARGLLVEEARTNLLLRSQELDNASWSQDGSTVSANAATAPDGTSTADKVVETATTNWHVVYQGITANAVAHTYSVYVKAAERTRADVFFSQSGVHGVNVDLTNGTVGTTTGTITSSSVEDVGNGWYRVKITKTLSATASFQAVGAASTNTTVGASYAGDNTKGIYVWGAQIEESASFPTSYIPTTSASVTRAAESAININTSAIPFSATAGALVVSALHGEALTGVGRIYAAFGSDDFGSEDIRIGEFGTSLAGDITDGGVTQASLSLSTIAALTAFKAGIAWAANDFAGVKDGGAASTDASGTLPTPTSLRLVHQGQTINGWIKQLTYIPRRITNGELQTRTT